MMHTDSLRVVNYGRVIHLESFGAWLVQKLDELGVSRNELARRIGVSSTWISKISRDYSPSSSSGKPQITKELAISIARALGIPEAEALDAAGFKTAAVDQQLDELKEDIDLYYAELPEDLRQLAVEQIKTLWKYHKLDKRVSANVQIPLSRPDVIASEPPPQIAAPKGGLKKSRVKLNDPPQEIDSPEDVDTDEFLRKSGT